MVELGKKPWQLGDRFPSVNPMHLQGGPGLEFNGFYFSPSGRILRFYDDDHKFRVLHHLGPSAALGPTDYTRNKSPFGFNIRSLEKDAAPWKDVMIKLLHQGPEGLTDKRRRDDPVVHRGDMTKFTCNPNLLRFGIRPIKARLTASSCLGIPYFISSHVLIEPFLSTPSPSLLSGSLCDLQWPQCRLPRV